MDFKKLVKGPIFWIFIAIFLILIGSNLISSANAAKKITTAEAVSAINRNEVSSVKLIDRDQRIEIVLRTGSKVQADFISGQGVDFSSVNWGMNMTCDLTTDSPQAFYLFVHSKQTLAFSQQGISVVR